MDPSALIFVALAVAWAVYLIPKALEHHEASDHSRTIDRFSHSLRVLGRREPVSPREARLVTSQASAAAATVAKPARRAAAERATRRRRNVLTAILVVLVATGALAGFGMLAVHWVAVPVVVLAAWLVACRLMVRKERAVPVRRTVAPASAAATVVAEPTEEAAAESAVDEDPTAEVPAVTAEDSGVGRWDPVQVPLPTYVSKPPAARRTVRTIDLDGTGVWSSGRNDADSALAREAEAARGAESGEQAKRQTGS